MGVSATDPCLDPGGGGAPGDVVLTISREGQAVTSLRKQADAEGDWYVEWHLPDSVTPGEYDFDAVCVPRGGDSPSRLYEHHTLTVAKDWLDMEWTGLPAVVAPGESMTGSSIEKCPAAATSVLWEMGKEVNGNSVMVGYGFFPVTNGDWSLTVSAPTTEGPYFLQVMCVGSGGPGTVPGLYSTADFSVSPP